MARRNRGTPSVVPTVDWGTYKQVVESFIESQAGRQPLLWLRKYDQPRLFGEDGGDSYKPIQIEGLLQYNFIRTWPYNPATSTGELSGNNTLLYISANLLRKGGFLNKHEYWDFNWSEDRFILDGHIYKPDGDTKASQIDTEALLFLVVLQREEPSEADAIFKLPTNNLSILHQEGLNEVNLGNTPLGDLILPIRYE